MTPYTYCRCPVNEMAALLGRHLYTELKPDEKVVRSFSRFAARYANEFYTLMDRNARFGATFQQYADKFTGGRRKALYDGLNYVLTKAKVDTRL